MKKLIVSLVASLALCLFASGAFAASDSAKTAIQVGSLSILKTAAGGPTGWHTIMKSVLHTSSQKDLVITPSLECALYTDTTASTKAGEKNGSTASAKVRVRVLIDGGIYAVPSHVDPDTGEVSGIAYCERTQTLNATLQGILSMCKDVDLDGYIDPNTECTLTEESVQLILDTTSAHSFSFIVPDVGVGDHTIEVQALIDTATSATNSTSVANATAAIGMGSVIVDEVRLVATPTEPIVLP